MDGRMPPVVGDSDPHDHAARTELLRALIWERFHRPPFEGRSRLTLIARRRRILLGKDTNDG